MSAGKNNGNGRDPHPDKNDDKIVKFPTLAERDRMKREERKQEEQWRKEYKKKQKAAEPKFFNFDRIPPFTRWFIGILLAAHIALHIFGNAAFRLKIIYMFGFIPASFTGGFEYNWWSPLTAVTHMAIHSGWMHLLFNGVMGLALGMLFERTFGTRAATLFFLLCGVAGAGLYFALNPHTITPVIGASGGISGLFGAAIILMMKQRRFNPALQKIGKYGPWPVVIFWGFFMLLLGLLGGGDMAWQAHLGGYIAGVVIFAMMEKGKLRL